MSDGFSTIPETCGAYLGKLHNIVNEAITPGYWGAFWTAEGERGTLSPSLISTVEVLSDRVRDWCKNLTYCFPATAEEAKTAIARIRLEYNRTGLPQNYDEFGAKYKRFSSSIEESQREEAYKFFLIAYEVCESLEGVVNSLFDVLRNIAGVEIESKEDITKIPDILPTPHGTEREREIFRKAMEAGLMSYGEGRYLWTNTKSLLACLALRLYNIVPIPYSELNRLFDKGLDYKTVDHARNSNIRGHELIDALFQ